MTQSMAISPLGPSEYARFACINAAWRLEQLGLTRDEICEIYISTLDYEMTHQTEQQPGSWKPKVKRVWHFCTATKTKAAHQHEDRRQR